MATVTFFSNYTEHVLVRRPQQDKPLQSGGWIVSQEPIRYKFQPAVNEKGELVGRLDVLEGQDLIEDHSGWLAQGQPFGVKRDAPTALRAHREFGRDMWEAGHEPGTLYPRPQDVRKLITRASVALDEDALLEIIETERRSHQRRDLIGEAETALETVREAATEIAAIRAAQDAEQPEEPAAAPPAPKAKAKPKAAARA